MFKVNFSEENGISDEDKNKLIESLKEIQRSYINIPVYAYATSIFRLMSEKQVAELKNIVYEKTGIIINIVSKDQESLYMAKSVGNIEELDEPYLVFSVGGSSTEFVVLEKGKIKENFTVEFAVGDVLKKYPSTSEDMPKNTFDEIYEYISANFAELPKTKCKYAIILEKVGARYIFPTDLNMIDGIVNELQEK